MRPSALGRRALPGLEGGSDRRGPGPRADRDPDHGGFRLAARAAEAGGMARVTLGGEVLYMERRPMVRLGKAMVALPPGGFLQATPQAEAAMADFAAEALAGAARVADLFCGAGTFAFRLAE